MYRIHSDSLVRVLPLLAAGVTLFSTPVFAQEKQAVEILSQQISTSRNGASLRLELSDGRAVDVAVRNGKAYLNGSPVGDAARDGTLDRSFRELLNALTDAPSEVAPTMLAEWQPPERSTAGTRLDRALEDAVEGIVATVAPASPVEESLEPVPASDSVDRLNQRINELESMVENLEDEDATASVNITGRQRWMPGPFHWIMRGLADVFSILVIYVIIFAVAIGVIFFGGRKYIEGVADTARQMTMRSWLVGLAATFLVIPAFILGIIALAISIVGIPALLVWVPLFPLGVLLAIGLGYLAVAHAAGESLAERRYYGADWFQRSNSYYFLLTGLGLLLALFMLSGVIEMAGPFFGWLRAMLIFLGVVVTWASLTIGFGAVLVSRGGTRPLGQARPIEDAFAEDSNG